MGAVVEGVPTTVHTPLSGQISPVLAVVPIGFFAMSFSYFCMVVSALKNYEQRKSKTL
jgi:hypothetical protein